LWPTIDPFLYTISATVRAGRTLEEVEAALDAEFDRLLAGPISQEELNTALKQARAQFAYSSESVTNQGFWLGLSAVVAEDGWSDSFVDRLASVTLADVQRVAQEVLVRRNRTVGHYVPLGLNAVDQAVQEVE